MDTFTQNTLYEIKKELARIADALEAKVPLNKLSKEASVRLTEEVPLPVGAKLSFSLAEAVVNEHARASSDIERMALKNCIIKYADRYFANAQESSDKLAKAYAELVQLRRRSNSDFMAGMKKVRDLVASDAAKRAVYFDGKQLGNDLLNAVDKLIELNTPFTTEVNLDDWETA